MVVTVSNTASQEKATVLVVDDDRIVRATAKKILGEQYQVLVASNGEEGWSALTANHAIDVLLCDLRMPVLGGYGLIKRMRESENLVFHNTPVIIITDSDDQEEVKLKIFACGADDFICKPFESVQLLARTKTFVRLSNSNKHAQNSLLECKKQATTDKETGLGTQPYFERAVNESIAFANRQGSDRVMMLIEVDNFNSIFIKNGKDLAAKIVATIGQLFKKFIRIEDTASRISLSKFAAFLACDSTEQAVTLAERLHLEISNLNFVDNHNNKIEVIPSIGIYMPKITQTTNYAEIFDKAEYCLKSALSSSSIKIVSNSEEPSVKNEILL